MRLSFGAAVVSSCSVTYYPHLEGLKQPELKLLRVSLQQKSGNGVAGFSVQGLTGSESRWRLALQYPGRLGVVLFQAHWLFIQAVLEWRPHFSSSYRKGTVLSSQRLVILAV